MPAVMAVKRLLPLRVQQQRFALPLEVVERLLPLAALHPLPLAPEYVMGLLNFEGQSLLVIDLAGRLGMPMRSHYPVDIPLVLLKCAAYRALLVVDEVYAVETLLADRLRGEVLFKRGTAPLQAVVEMAAGTTLLLDCLRLLDVEISPGVESALLDADLLTQSRIADTSASPTTVTAVELR
ncbi:MAG: chemotaxis protein CheW [Gammaproteobacteria bacterium]|nr:chemotaxis protein CheW [Gammaproteobacteria bacterium]